MLEKLEYASTAIAQAHDEDLRTIELGGPRDALLFCLGWIGQKLSHERITDNTGPGAHAMNKIIEQIENAQLKSDVPEFGSGDTLVVQVKVREGNRERLQAFEGVVIACRNRGLNSAFTLRKTSHGVGVERTFQT